MSTAEALRREIKPYRTYDRWAGHIALKTDRKIPLAPTTEITFHDVATLLKKHGLKVRRQTVVDLAEALSIINGTVPHDEAYPPELVAKTNTVAAALDAISEHLPILIELMDNKNLSDALTINALSDLEISASNAGLILTKFRQRHPSTFWHDDAEYLHWCMGGALTSRGVQASFTKPGSPAVKFIHNAFKLARLWHPRFDREYIPPCSAIADALDKRQKAVAAG